jgi:hypothetical protein
MDIIYFAASCYLLYKAVARFRRARAVSRYAKLIG